MNKGYKMQITKENIKVLKHPVINHNLSLQNGTVSGTTVKLQETRDTYAQYRENPQRYTLILDESMYIYPPIEDHVHVGS